MTTAEGAVRLHVSYYTLKIFKFPQALIIILYNSQVAGEDSEDDFQPPKQKQRAAKATASKKISESALVRAFYMN